jgi:hypothetical protein
VKIQFSPSARNYSYVFTFYSNCFADIREYANVAPISDLAAVTKIEKGTDLNIEKSKEELEEFAPLEATADIRIDEPMNMTVGTGQLVTMVTTR